MDLDYKMRWKIVELSCVFMLTIEDMLTCDSDIRNALKYALQSLPATDPDTIILEEFGLCQGAARIDMAVVNGELLGFEIKSENDSLERLEKQQEVYSKTLERVFIVTASKHIDSIKENVPSWWGIIEIEAAKFTNNITLKEHRPSKKNPSLDPHAIVQLLWKGESLHILENIGLSQGLRNKPRTYLWKKLADTLPLNDLTEYVKTYLRSRPNWRSPRKIRKL